MVASVLILEEEPVQSPDLDQSQREKTTESYEVFETEGAPE